MIDISVGIDIGSTTVKVIVTDRGKIIFRHYERHFSQVRQKTAEVLYLAKDVIGARPFTVAISGSAGFGVAKSAGLEFVQEVFATGKAMQRLEQNIDIVIELGGEDAKILFLTGGLEERMNGTCAGGTGAFIDQMASLLNVSLDELDELSLEAEKIYPIASRCGVFAKSDIQPLLNQGAKKSDIAASIFQAVVDQTITGLAQGRKLEGRIAFLGGPLFFFKGLQKRFYETLNLTKDTALFPDWSQFSVAIGAASYAAENSKEYTFPKLLSAVENTINETHNSHSLEPLFKSEKEYKEFSLRHAKATLSAIPIDQYEGDAFLGIDSGSTTIKLVLISDKAEILYQYYSSNQGNPVDLIKDELLTIWKLCGNRINLRTSVVTGYGEDLIKSAFHIDAGVVETMAHFKATRYFKPEVDFILDIGGQDIKCFQIKNDSIDSIMLNEACSSGCGSFIETFAKSMGYNIEEFAKLGIFAENPVDLGSRCTVFMNSSVKQAQKEGSTVGDISAGLSMSVVKNAVYKVIRAKSIESLGKNIVVQGGTFYNDAVLRSFEKELGRDVTRPAIAGLMGAFGAALYGRDLKLKETSTMKSGDLETFSHSSKPIVCGHCTNKCNLNVITFADGTRHISGNKCDRPLKNKQSEPLPNIYTYKRNKIANLSPSKGKRGSIGIPMGLNMFENIPFWHTFLSELGFYVILSDPSSAKLYRSGCRSIPSDTACYPAKLMHGHIANLLQKGITTIFYPCMTYNFDEKKGDNHYNCPVVAYYPELLHANVAELADIQFLYPYCDLNNPHIFEKKIFQYLKQYFKDITFSEIKQASNKAFETYENWQKDIKREGAKALAFAKAKNLPVIVLAGRPYHIDAEINHGIDRMLEDFNLVVLSEDCVADLVEPQKVRVLNQWTYHSRLYNAAKYCTLHENTELVQLVSFGCGIDAITTDEVRDILEKGNKFYTQLKIDEINTLGAIKIRIRSLLGAMEERKRKAEQAGKEESI